MKTETTKQVGIRTTMNNELPIEAQIVKVGKDWEIQFIWNGAQRHIIGDDDYNKFETESFPTKRNAMARLAEI